MDALVLIFIWLCNLTARAIAAILRHILIFDSFVISLFTVFWLHMERGWGLVAVWMLGIVIFFALVALSAQKATAIILSVIATAFWTISLEEIWRGLFYSSQEPFGGETDCMEHHFSDRECWSTCIILQAAQIHDSGGRTDHTKLTFSSK